MAKKPIEPTEDTLEDMEEKSTSANRYDLSEEEEEVRQTVYTRFKAMKDGEERVAIEEEWDNADKAYRAEPAFEKSPDDPRSNINKPIIFSTVETELQETIERSSRPTVKPREYDDQAKTDLINDVLRYSFDVGSFDYQFYLAKKESLIRGTGFLMEYYREDKRVVSDLNIVKDGESGEYKEEYKLREQVDFDDCYAEYVPSEMIYIDPSASHIEKAKDMIRREVLNIHEFRRIYKDRRGFKNVDLIVAGGDTNFYTFYQPPHDIDDNEDVEVLHYYNRAIDRYDVVANDVPIRLGPIPGPVKELPISVFYCYKHPNFFYGFGIPKIISPLVEERNTLSNLRIDYLHQAISKMFVYDDSVELDDIDFVTRPNGGIPVNTGGRPLNQVIQWLEYGDVKPSSYKEDELINDDIRRTTGIDDRIQGLNVGGTATEAAILKESAMKRINAKAKLWEIDGLVRLGKMRIENIRFFYPIPKVERIIGKNGEEQTKKTYKKVRIEDKQYNFDQDGNLQVEQLQGQKYSFFKMDKKGAKALEGQFDIVVDADAATPLSKPLKQAKVTEMLMLISKNPALMQELDPNKAVKRYLKVNDEYLEDWMKGEVSEYDDATLQSLAEQENTILANGIPLPPTPLANEAHTMVHLNYTKTAEHEQLDQNLKDAIQAHITGEAAKQGIPIPQAPPGGAPQGAPPGMPPGAQGPGGMESMPAPGINPVDIQPSGGMETAPPGTPDELRGMM